jgi:hypothetical protein
LDGDGLKKSIILISKEIQMEQGEYRTCRRLSTEGLSDVFELYAQELGSSTNAETKSLFEAISQARQSRTPHANANSLLEHTVW